MSISRRRFTQGLLTFITVSIVIARLFPLFWLISTALKSRLQAFAIPPVWFFKPTLENFSAVLGSMDFMKGYNNSLIVVLWTTLVSLVLGIAGGYSLARVSTRSTKMMGGWILVARMAPPMGLALPFYLMFRKLALLDKYAGLVLIT